MTMAATATEGFDLRAIANAFVPGRFKLDPLGFVSGYKAYQIYTGLSVKSDAELTSLGLDRRELPRVAMKAADALRRR